MSDHPFENTYDLSNEQLLKLEEAEDEMLKNNLGKIPANFCPSTNRSFGHFILTLTPTRSILSTKANATANP